MFSSTQNNRTTEQTMKRTTTRLLLLLLLIFTSRVSATFQDRVDSFLGKRDTQDLKVRADDSESSSESLLDVSEVNTDTKSSKSSAKSSAKSDKKSDGKSDSKSDSKSSSKDSKSESKSKGKSTSKSSTTSSFSTSINPELPAGVISFVTPVSTESTYIKIGELATFKWKYTSLLVTPTALIVEAYCSENSQTYTIETSLPAKHTEFVWDTSDLPPNQTVDYVTSEYTLYIYDYKSNLTAQASAGYLEALDYVFGMYLPQSYTPWAKDDSYINSAWMEGPTSKFLLTMVAIVVGTMVKVMIF